ncbi:MAG: response regulator [Ignavibacteria bacterium]|jgi:CheY-like chemotaxis protein|nr:response regulator [Ignavibacteria bacterium]MCU7504363.1 response regulator [Ignavibacteria bacterium]MCU7517586.1 response regulator [Ignavibacteria bacterium]
MLVEDNQDDEELTLLALKKNNITNEVVVVHDGIEALDYLLARGSYSGRDSKRLPAVVLLDLNLPGINGIEVLRELRGNPETKLIPVVVLTTSNNSNDIINSYSVGANSYVIKPIDFNQFVDLLSCLGPYWLVINELPFAIGGK